MFAEMTWLWFDGCMTRPLTVEVPDSDRVLLETRVAGATTPRRDWQRAMIVLMAAQGVASPKIAALRIALTQMSEGGDGQAVLDLLRLDGFAIEETAFFDPIAVMMERVRSLG